VDNFSLSSQSGDSLFDHRHSVGSHLVVDGLPLIIVVLLNADRAVNDRLSNVDEEEGWHEGEQEADPISGQTHIEHAVAFKTAQTLPELLVGWLFGEGVLLASQAGNVQINARSQFGLHLETLDHLDHLGLLLVGH